MFSARRLPKKKRGKGSGPPRAPLTTEFPQCVRNAFSSTLGVCAYVILFSVLTRLADCSGLLPFLVNVLSSLLPGENAPVLCRSFCVGLMELSTGTASIRDGVSSPLSLPLAAFILGWGGLSVHCQSLPFWREAGVPSGPYLRAKFLHGLLSAGITALVRLLFPLSLPAMAPVTPLACPQPCLDRKFWPFGEWLVSIFSSSTRKEWKSQKHPL